MTTSAANSGALLSIAVANGAVTQHRLWGPGGQSRKVRSLGGRVALIPLDEPFSAEAEVYARDAWAAPLWRWRGRGTIVDATSCGGLAWMQEAGAAASGTRGRLVALSLDDGSEVTALDLGAPRSTVSVGPTQRMAVSGGRLFAVASTAEGTFVVGVDCASRRPLPRRWRVPDGAWLLDDARPGGRLLVAAPDAWDEATQRVLDATVSRFDPDGDGVSAPYYRTPHSLTGVASTSEGWTAVSQPLGGQGLTSNVELLCVDAAGVARHYDRSALAPCAFAGHVAMVGDEAWGLVGACPRPSSPRFTRIYRWRVDAACAPLPTIAVDDRLPDWIEPDH